VSDENAQKNKSLISSKEEVKSKLSRMIRLFCADNRDFDMMYPPLFIVMLFNSLVYLSPFWNKGYYETLISYIALFLILNVYMINSLIKRMLKMMAKNPSTYLSNSIRQCFFVVISGILVGFFSVNQLMYIETQSNKEAEELIRNCLILLVPVGIFVSGFNVSKYLKTLFLQEEL